MTHRSAAHPGGSGSPGTDVPSGGRGPSSHATTGPRCAPAAPCGPLPAAKYQHTTPQARHSTAQQQGYFLIFGWGTEGEERETDRCASLSLSVLSTLRSLSAIAVEFDLQRPPTQRE